jgi:hypothetical protein
MKREEVQRHLTGSIIELHLENYNNRIQFAGTAPPVYNDRLFVFLRSRFVATKDPGLRPTATRVRDSSLRSE